MNSCVMSPIRDECNITFEYRLTNEAVFRSLPVTRANLSKGRDAKLPV
jgi:hypothetical protein